MGVMSAGVGRRVRRVAESVLQRSRVTLSRPVFIWGAPRSGTHLLYDLLSLHPDVACPRAWDRRKKGIWGGMHWGDDTPAALRDRPAPYERTQRCCFEAGARLRAPGEIFPVRRIKRRGVAARAGGNFLRHSVAQVCNLRVSRRQVGNLPHMNWHDENFVVRTGRFDFVHVARVSEFLAIGRNRVHILTAEIERRHIMIARRKIVRRAICGGATLCGAVELKKRK